MKVRRVLIVLGLASAVLLLVFSAAEPWLRLERLGQVPEDADVWDWWLAQKTSWWGKRLDPKEFWKGRVLWLDTSARKAAGRHGRGYPPIPYEDPAFAARSDADVSSLPSADNPGVLSRFSDKENAFWDKFVKTHPHPPEHITDQQTSLASTSLGRWYGFEHGGNPSRLTEAEVRASDQVARRRKHELGYPPEAFTDEALHWAYVLEQRGEYERRYIRTHAENTFSSSNFLAGIWVESKLITEPLTREQEVAANAWKVAYLQRLRREGTDESYINAYLKAWKLSESEVFGSKQDPAKHSEN